MKGALASNTVGAYRERIGGNRLLLLPRERRSSLIDAKRWVVRVGGEVKTMNDQTHSDSRGVTSGNSYRWLVEMSLESDEHLFLR